MNTYIAKLLQRHRRGGVLLDTNLLLLYFVGLFDQKIIPTFKRTKMFAKEDYSTLLGVLRHFKMVVTTPNILTEVSNLSGQLPERLRLDYFETFAHGTTLLDEHYCSSSDISKMEELKRFGLTDAGIFRLAKGNYLTITDDFRLSQYLQKKSIDVLNFNHIRIINWK